MAMGAVTVGLCSTSDETIPIAEKDLPKNLCPMVKQVMVLLYLTMSIFLFFRCGCRGNNL